MATTLLVLSKLSARISLHRIEQQRFAFFAPAMRFSVCVAAVTAMAAVALADMRPFGPAFPAGFSVANLFFAGTMRVRGADLHRNDGRQYEVADDSLDVHHHTAVDKAEENPDMNDAFDIKPNIGCTDADSG